MEKQIEETLKGEVRENFYGRQGKEKVNISRFGFSVIHNNHTLVKTDSRNFCVATVKMSVLKELTKINGEKRVTSTKSRLISPVDVDKIFCLPDEQCLFFPFLGISLLMKFKLRESKLSRLQLNRIINGLEKDNLISPVENPERLNGDTIKPRSYPNLICLREFFVIINAIRGHIDMFKLRSFLLHLDKQSSNSFSALMLVPSQ